LEGSKNCLISVEILPLKDRHNKKEITLLFIDLVLAGFNRHSIESARWKDTGVQLEIDLSRIRLYNLLGKKKGRIFLKLPFYYC
jgi:hypothetical protein